MASYIPAQRNVQSWESTPPKPGQRAPIQFPRVSSGSRRSFEGHASGDPEFQTPTLNRTTDFLKRNVGNYLLYKSVYERGTEKIVNAEHEIRDKLSPPSVAPVEGGEAAPGALAKLPLPTGGQPGSPRRRPAGMDPRKRGTFTQVPGPATNMGGLFDPTPKGGNKTGANRPAWMPSQ